MNDCITELKDIDPSLFLDSDGDYEPTVVDFLHFKSDIRKQEKKSKLSIVFDAEGNTVFIASEEIARWLCKLANKYFDEGKE
jgi:hypothetical protein